MYRKPTKRQLLIRRGIILTIMVISVIVILIGTVLSIMGYRLDSANGRLEQGALIQFNSNPTGAAVTINGISTGSQTTTKRTVMAGEQRVEMSRGGYHTWQRTVSVQPGTLTWLDYARLVPTNLAKQTVRTYDAVADVSASPNQRTVVIHPVASRPTFDVVDIRSQDVRSQEVTLPNELITDRTTEGVTHLFELDAWDEDGRYLLIKHSYRDVAEWIVFDTENVSQSTNINRSLNITVPDIQFAGTNGNVLYGLTDGSIRRLDVGNGTISRALVSNVASFSVAPASSTLTYVGTEQDRPDRVVAGFYRDGDREPHIVTAVDAPSKLSIATHRYANNDYIAVATDQKVNVYKGRYPGSGDSIDKSMSIVETFDISGAVDQLSFSPDGDYVIARSGAAFVTYEVEYDRVHRSSIDTKQPADQPLTWIDDAHISVVYDGHLTMRDFDGTNSHIIMPNVAGFGSTLSENGKYIYGVNNTDGKYRLERVTMILN